MHLNTNRTVFISFIVIILFTLGCSSTKTIPQDSLPNPPQTPAQQDTIFYSDSHIFDLLFSEAKSFYVEALIADHFHDSSEVQYCFDRAFEIIAEISEMDTLNPLQRDDFERFYDKIAHDYQRQFSHLNADSGSYGVASVRQDIVTTLLDTVRVGGDELVVLDDRPGHFPLVSSKKIKRIIDYFQTREHERFQQWLDNSGLYKDLMMPILKKHGLPDELFYLALIESGFNPTAYSYAHAAGPWQFISSTGHKYGLKRDWWIDERRDPIKSTHAAAKYLSTLYEMFDDWFLALAAYNCGELRVYRAIRREGTRDYWKLRSLPKQTRNYIPTLMAGITIAMDPEKYGFENTPKDTWEWDEIVLDRSYELEAIAQQAGITATELRKHNPELRRWTTPPDRNEYVLRVPPGKGEGLLKRIQDLPASSSEPQWVTHTVRRGQTLSYIANKYGTSVSSLIAANNIRNQNRIKIGQKLLVPMNSYHSPVYSAPKGKTKLTHIVRKGETLSEIAEAYGVGLSRVRAWNNLYGKRFIYPGQKLHIYTNSAGSTTKAAQNEDGSLTHIVRKGESLSLISQRYRVSVRDLRDWNNLHTQRYIYPGQKIVVRKGGATMVTASADENGKIIHVVRKGETLSEIAERYGVGLSKVRSWNNLYGRRYIYPGQKIVIYKSVSS